MRPVELDSIDRVDGRVCLTTDGSVCDGITSVALEGKVLSAQALAGVRNCDRATHPWFFSSAYLHSKRSGTAHRTDTRDLLNRDSPFHTSYSIPITRGESRDDSCLHLQWGLFCLYSPTSESPPQNRTATHALDDARVLQIHETDLPIRRAEYLQRDDETRPRAPQKTYHQIIHRIQRIHPLWRRQLRNRIRRPHIPVLPSASAHVPCN